MSLYNLVDDEEDEMEDSPGVSKFGAIFIVCGSWCRSTKLSARVRPGRWLARLSQLAVMALALVGLHYLTSGARKRVKISEIVGT